MKGTPQKRSYSREAEVREIKTVLGQDEVISAEWILDDLQIGSLSESARLQF